MGYFIYYFIVAMVVHVHFLYIYLLPEVENKNYDLHNI